MEDNKMSHTLRCVPRAEFVHIPELAVGGIVGSPSIISEFVGSSGTLTVKLPNKYVQRLKRSFQRSLTGSNNQRKRHGLPMYRKAR